MCIHRHVHLHMCSYKIHTRTPISADHLPLIFIFPKKKNPLIVHNLAHQETDVLLHQKNLIRVISRNPLSYKSRHPSIHTFPIQNFLFSYQEQIDERDPLLEKSLITILRKAPQWDHVRHTRAITSDF